LEVNKSMPGKSIVCDEKNRTTRIEETVYEKRQEI
jgi:hypothetical protein